MRSNLEGALATKPSLDRCQSCRAWLPCPEATEAWLSDAAQDDRWDAFLASTPLGQYQQSATWGQVKVPEGWRVARVVFSRDDRIEGGFQALWRTIGFVRFGYVSKGPVFRDEASALARQAAVFVEAVARRLRIRMLMLQAPDQSRGIAPLFTGSSFCENDLVGVITANLVVGLTGGPEVITGRMSRQTRQKIRQANARGITIREGDERDLPSFLALLLATCRRQAQAKPYPATLNQLRHLWACLASRHCIRLSFAVHDAQPVSGLLSIVFGSRLTFWKKGWSGEHAEKHPNALLFHEALLWGHQRGYTAADFAGLDRGIAETLLQEQPLSESQKRSRDFAHLGFGGEPVLLPKPRLWVANRLWWVACRALSACARARRHGRRLAARASARRT